MKIEISTNRDRFTPEEIKRMVRESKTYWNSPAGKRRQAELDREKRSLKLPKTKFPHLAARSTTKPELTVVARRRHLLDKIAH